MSDRSPKERPYRHDPPQDELAFDMHRWFGRLLVIVGGMLGIGLWLLAAEAVFLTLTR